ncbi:protein TonB [Dokdonella fugitiva]|uniref:Protein TonB n=1 Tax=Dokdonella fugitiva TaxID=328517 RepID=A0A839EYZ3_9GAMM|nr:energy transducer TonB [Dokdonella fugitiva]MBA8889937.1 protein TonB [Dokdonella fugitiva]
MATRAAAHHPQPDWQRIAALSTSFLMHAVAAMAVAVPLAMQVERIESRPVAASLIDTPPPVPPPPPEQLPPPRAPVHHATPQPPPVAPPVPVRSVIEVPAPPAPIDATPVQPTTPSATSDVADGAGTGETRRLAYDGALKLKYPATALRSRQQGEVLLSVLVDPSGNVQRIEIARSSGHADLDNAAREAVQRAHFKPVLRDGQAIAAWGTVPIEFRLDRA